jgi:hypothetical protein
MIVAQPLISFIFVLLLSLKALAFSIFSSHIGKINLGLTYSVIYSKFLVKIQRIMHPSRF